MILKHFERYSDKFIEHLGTLAKKLKGKDAESIHVALYEIAEKRELSGMLSDVLKEKEVESFLIVEKILSFYVKGGNPEIFKQKIERYKRELFSS